MTVSTDLEAKVEDIEHTPDAETAPEEKRKLTAAEWAECRSLYELGEARTPELAERFGVTKQAISKHFKENKVEFQSKKKELEEKMAAAVTAVATGKVTTAVASFESTRKAKIEETKIEAYADGRLIAQLNRKVLVDAARGGTAIGTFGADLKALRVAAATLMITQDARYKILKMDDDIDEESLPEIRIIDLSEKQLKRMREQSSEDPELDLPDIDLDDDEDNEIIETS